MSTKAKNTSATKKSVANVSATSAKAAKAPAKKSAPVKEEKKAVEKSVFGHKIGSQAAAIDQIISSKKGQELAFTDVAVLVHSTPSRVKAHVVHLIKAKKVNIKIEKAVFKLAA